MASVRIFTIIKNGELFRINSDYTKRAIADFLAIAEEKEGFPHKTLNIIPEFPRESGGLFAPDSSNCRDGEVIALYCIATFQPQ